MRPLCLALVLISIFATSAHAQNTPDITIQRVGVLGFSDDGNTGAFLLLHFGPSSKAPFVRLQVIAANNPLPLFEDDAFMIAGGEMELAYLAQTVIERNQEKLKAMGINLSSPLYDVANYIVESHTKKKISGWVDVEHAGLSQFSLVSSPSAFCQDSPGIDLKLCVGSNCVESKSQQIEKCGFTEAQIKTIYRSKSALWFMVVQKNEVMPGLLAYFITPVGLKF